MLVADLRERMTYDEYVLWGMHYGRKAQAKELAEGRR